MNGISPRFGTIYGPVFGPTAGPQLNTQKGVPQRSLSQKVLTDIQAHHAAATDDFVKVTVYSAAQNYREEPIGSMSHYFAFGQDAKDLLTKLQVKAITK